jgi:hypothetical protein
MNRAEVGLANPLPTFHTFFQWLGAAPVWWAFAFNQTFHVPRAYMSRRCSRHWRSNAIAPGNSVTLKLLDCQAWTKYEAGAGIIDP